MNCPYCNKEMKSGFLKSSHLIYWGEDKTLAPFLNGIRLTKFNLEGFFKGNFVESYYCSDCKKIIVSFDDK